MKLRRISQHGFASQRRAAGITAKETQPHWGRHKNAASGGAAKEVPASKGKINEWKAQQRNRFFVQHSTVR